VSAGIRLVLVSSIAASPDKREKYDTNDHTGLLDDYTLDVFVLTHRRGRGAGKK
jgi:hypothetical protein